MNKIYLGLFTLLIFSFSFLENAFSQTANLPFRGGSQGGYTVGSKVSGNCNVNEGYNFFTSGFGGGFANHLKSNTTCETAIEVSPFLGGAIQGLFNSRLNNIASCEVEVSLSFYSGGSESGYKNFRRTYWNCDGENSTVTSVSPLEVCQGDSILITGTLLSDIEYVEFIGALTNQFIVIDSTQVRSLVPIGAQTGFVGVTGPNGTTAGLTQIEINPLPFATFTYEQITGLTFNFSSSNPASVTHFWDFGDGNTSTQQNPSHTYTNEGLYEVSLSVENDCGDDERITEINAINVGLASQNIAPKVSVYPNPFNDSFTIEVVLNEAENIHINVYSLTGKLIQSEQISGQRNFTRHIDLSQYSSGFFVVQLISKNNVVTKKVVKR